MTTRPRPTLTTATRLNLSLGLAASLRVLRHDASGLSLYLEEQATMNPLLRLEKVKPAASEWLPRWSRVLGGGDGGTEVAGAGPSLIAHVMAGIARLFPGAAERRLAMVLAGALEPSGWLGRPLEVLAGEAGVGLAALEPVLRRLQAIEPAGLFARNLAECLELQLREAGWFDPVAAVILSRLDLLAAGDTARLARLAGVSVSEISLRKQRIRGLNPKPGTLFEAGAAPVREPDLLAVRGPAGWTLALNRSALPAVSVAVAKGDPDQRAAARALVRQVQARGATLLRVGSEVLRRQGAVLDRGMAALVPMTMADVANTLDLHESTVSRAVAGCAVDTPLGTFWLRHFFTGAVRADDAGPAAGALRAVLARLVAAEDPARPLSDAALAVALGEAVGSPPPARRTVAKYRDGLGIPAAHRRRR